MPSITEILDQNTIDPTKQLDALAPDDIIGYFREALKNEALHHHCSLLFRFAASKETEQVFMREDASMAKKLFQCARDHYKEQLKAPCQQAINKLNASATMKTDPYSDITNYLTCIANAEIPALIQGLNDIILQKMLNDCAGRNALQNYKTFLARLFNSTYCARDFTGSSANAYKDICTIIAAFGDAIYMPAETNAKQKRIRDVFETESKLRSSRILMDDDTKTHDIATLLTKIIQNFCPETMNQDRAQCFQKCYVDKLNSKLKEFKRASLDLHKPSIIVKTPVRLPLTLVAASKRYSFHRHLGFSVYASLFIVSLLSCTAMSFARLFSAKADALWHAGNTFVNDPENQIASISSHIVSAAVLIFSGIELGMMLKNKSRLPLISHFWSKDIDTNAVIMHQNKHNRAETQALLDQC